MANDQQWTPARLGDRSGQRVIVTGATNGIGLATAHSLARAGAHVILAVRNVELGEKRAAQMGGSTEVSHVDLSDLASVRAFADRLTDDVDVLINNAGLVAQKREKTTDGFEMSIGTNFLGPFALTNLVAPRVRAQIINVGSDAHKFATLDLDDLHLSDARWNPMGAYGRSKLAVMLWGLELDRRLRESGSAVTTALTHPGWVASNLSNVSDAPLMSVFHTVTQTIAKTLANDTDAGAAPTLYCMTEPIPPGSYVGIDSRLGLKGGPTLAGRTAHASDYALAARLWDRAESETGTTWPVG
ncbi:SDR family NAD(P)-dependent oxidoreductase [Williamsia sp. M5A3_1d]